MIRPMRWDIFCRVVDNFGDIGVCWRLARILAAQHACEVRLIVDRPELLQRIVATPSESLNASKYKGIEVVRWGSTSPSECDCDVVVEAFACELPLAYTHAMVNSRPRPLWINLEYLSAEDWVAGCHLCASRHPQLGADKFFFFPGFTASTGGLLREATLIETRKAFCRQAEVAQWAALGIAPPSAGERRMSLFGYENPAVPELLELLAEGTSEWTVLVPEGRSLPEVARFFGHREARPGDAWQRGRVRARVLPFTDQDHYDRLLWCCDLNLVRGEDSLVRALWSGRPLLWQPYPQDQGAHLDKLEALLNCAKLGLGAAAAESLGALMRAWNGIGSVAASWPVFENALEAQRSAFAGWSEKLAAGPELAASLVRFAELKLK